MEKNFYRNFDESRKMSIGSIGAIGTIGSMGTIKKTINWRLNELCPEEIRKIRPFKLRYYEGNGKKG